MSYYRKRPLLIGAALLFGAPGCWAAPIGPSGPTRDAGLAAPDAGQAEQDAGQLADIGGPVDSGTPTSDTAVHPADDAGVEPADDAGVEPADDAGVEPADDAGVEPADDAGVEPANDAGIQPPAPGEPCEPDGSAACDIGTTMPDLICIRGVWTAVERGWTDTDLLCGICSDIDPFGVGTSQCAPAVLDGRCFYGNAAVCDDQGIATMICQGGT
jgi:hypothetical protein